MSNLPCKTKKCLVYPSCRYKYNIECSLLHAHYLKIHESVGLTKLQSDKVTWKIVHETFPNLKGIFRDTKETQFQL